MKREEQTRMMKEKIIQSAILEFNNNDYESASMNRICNIGCISKGIIYHYFKDKDALYLECVKRCYDTFINYYRMNEVDMAGKNIDITDYLKLRMLFFKEHPQFRGLFFHTLLRTPHHLRNEVMELKQNLDCLNSDFYKQYLLNINLRDTVSVNEAVRYMEIIQNAFNDYFRNEAENGANIKYLIDQHEKMIPKWINFILFGIAKE